MGRHAAPARVVDVVDRIETVELPLLVPETEPMRRPHPPGRGPMSVVLLAAAVVLAVAAAVTALGVWGGGEINRTVRLHTESTSSMPTPSPVEAPVIGPWNQLPPVSTSSTAEGLPPVVRTYRTTAAAPAAPTTTVPASSTAAALTTPPPAPTTVTHTETQTQTSTVTETTATTTTETATETATETTTETATFPTFPPIPTDVIP